MNDNFKTRYDELLNKCVVPNASGRTCFSLAMLTDDEIRWIAEECPSWDYLTDVTDDGGNNLYQIAAEKGFAPKDSDDENGNAPAWFAVVDDDYTDWDNGSDDRRVAESIAWERIDAGHKNVEIAVIVNDFCTEVIKPADFRTPHIIGKWAGSDIDVVEIDGSFYALDGWNGEKYLHCWKCIDRFTAAPDGEEYEIRPVYDWSAWNDDAGEFQDENGGAISGIIGYEIA